MVIREQARVATISTSAPSSRLPTGCDRLLGRSHARVADPIVGGQLAADPFDGIERNAQVHHAPHVPQRQLEADQHDHFVGRDDLHELRIALHPFHFEFQRQDVGPGPLQIVQEQAGDAADQAQFDFRQRPTGDDTRFLAATQQPVDDRIEDRRVDVEDQVAFRAAWR